MFEQRLEFFKFDLWSFLSEAEIKPRRWTAKNRFQLSANANLETLNKISSGTNHVWAAS